MSRAHPIVYLAGPITGGTFENATDWRKWVQQELADVDVRTLNPMRMEEYLKPQQIMPQVPDRYGNVRIHPKGIVARDRYDCRTSDLVLMNLLPSRQTGIPSKGSLIEAGWTNMAQVPLVVVIDGEDNPSYHALLEWTADYVVDTLEEGVEITKAVLLP